MNNETPLSICSLCGKTANLRDSHIIPGFVYRFLLKTSGTGFLRRGVAPNLRVQDGFKSKILCDNCELCFQQCETPFAEKFFTPLHEGKVSHPAYDHWLKRFAASVSWRNLYYHIHNAAITSNVDKCNQDVYQEALETWRSYLIGKRSDIGRFEQHIFCMDLIQKLPDNKNVPPNINRFLTRTVEFTVGRNHKEAFTYTKMMKVIIFGFIKIAQPKHWQGTQIADGASAIQRNFKLSSSIWNFLMQRARNQIEFAQRLSPKQRAKIDQAYNQNRSRFAKSQLFKAMQRDVEMFGEDAFELR